MTEREEPQTLGWVNPYEGTGERFVELAEKTLREAYGLDPNDPLPKHQLSSEEIQERVENDTFFKKIEAEI